MTGRALLLSLLTAGAALVAQEGGLTASVNLGFRASNFYRNREAGDNFFGIRGMFQVETERVWCSPADSKRSFWDVRLFGSISVDGKNESAFSVQESDTTQTYLKRVVKETSNYSAEVGLKTGLFEWSPQARVWLVGSWTFRNASQRAQRFDASGAAVDPDAVVEYSDQSKTLDKLGLRLGDRDKGGKLAGSFLEVAHLYDRFYTYEKNRFLLRGRLAVQTGGGGKLLGWLAPDGFYVEGALSRAWARHSSLEKDESTLVFGMRYLLEP